MKQEPEPIFSLYNLNTGSLEDVFSNTLNSASNPCPSDRHESPTNENIEFDDDFSEDCEMIGDTVPRPLASTSEGLIKIEGDIISNDKPFITSVYCKLL